MDVKELEKSKIKSKIKAFTPIFTIFMRGIIGFLLARGLIFAEYAPFGLAWCAVGGTPGAIGAVLGYISILYKANSLKYIAICVLIYTGGYVFKDTALIKKQIFMPLVVLICTAAIGFVFVLDSDNPFKSGIFYFAELLIATLCTYFYQTSQRVKSEMRRKTGIAVLATTLILPLSSICCFGLSIGRIIACLLILIAGYYNGIGGGCAAGVTLSFAMGGGHLSAIYGICGLATPLFKGRGQAVYCLSFFILVITGTLWVKMDMDYTLLWESAVAVIAFVPIVRLFGKKIAAVLNREEISQTYNRLQKQLEERIDNTARALSQLSLIFSGAQKEERADYSSVFDAPLQKVCKKCVLSHSCWEREYASSSSALDKAIGSVEQNGVLTREAFPNHFSARCIKMDKFIEEANNELFKLLYRRKHKAQIEESRSFIKKQYGEMAKITARLKDELNLSADRECEAKIADFFEKNEIRAYPTVYRDGRSNLCIEIDGDHTERLCRDGFAKELSDFLQIRLKAPVLKDETVIIRQKENFKVLMGASLNKKDGVGISGDAGSYYRTSEGSLAVLLADGMGSGREAACGASNAIKIAERFHRAKIDMRLSLSAINTALRLKGEESPGFVTLDFMELDLYTGMARLYKCGSAPTYVRSGGKVRKINSTTLPVGTPTPGENNAELFEFQARCGDFIVFITDGVIDATDDLWLCELISEYRGDSPRELSGEIVASAVAKFGAADDMTVLIAYVDKNE